MEGLEIINVLEGSDDSSLVNFKQLYSHVKAAKILLQGNWQKTKSKLL